MEKVFFYKADKNIYLNNRNTVKNLIKDLFKKENKEMHRINYIFCSDDYLKTINIKFLKHDYYTDVITFSLSEQNSPVTGEVYLSVDRIKENAKHFGTSFKTELMRVIIHGSLHLCGYNDLGKKQKSLMAEKENYYLKCYDQVSREAKP